MSEHSTTVVKRPDRLASAGRRTPIGVPCHGAGSMAAVHGGWQYVPAMVVLTLLVAAYRRWHGRSTGSGRVETLAGEPAELAVTPGLHPVPEYRLIVES